MKKFLFSIKNIELFVVLGFITLYTIGAILVSLHRYWQFDAFWLDFGIFDETVWRLSRFQLPIVPNLSPPLGKIVWADHFNPSAILVAPFYWLSSKTEIIFIAQALFVGLSGFVMYLTSKKKVTRALVRVALVVSYFGFVGLQNALYTDVHNIVFALLPLSLTIYSIYYKKWNWYWIFLIISMGFQENMAAVVISLGAFLLLRKDRTIKIGLITICAGFSWAFLSGYVIIPLFKGSGYSYQPDIPVFWWEWFTRFVHPFDMKLRTIVLTLTTFGLLPILSVATYPLIIEHFLERFVFNVAATRWDLGFHYNALLSPIMFLACIEAIENLKKHPKIERLLPIWSIFTVITVIFLHRFYLHGPLMLATHPVFYEQTVRAVFLRSFEEKIPTDGLLMTQNNLAPHFTHHNIVILNANIDYIQPDIIAVDTRPGQNANNFFPLSPQQFEDFVASVSARLDYVKTEVTDSQLIFRKIK